MHQTRHARPSVGTLLRTRCVAIVAALAAAASAHAAPMTLDVEGRIAHTTDAAHTVYRFTEADLLKLPAHTITTATAWTPKSAFAGPSLADILRTVGAQGDAVEVRAFDDFNVTIPIAEAEHYGVILACSMNGKRLQMTDFGPLFLIYPRDQYPEELSGAAATNKFVWQVRSLVVK
jgi:hypothetical protein